MKGPWLATFWVDTGVPEINFGRDQVIITTIAIIPACTFQMRQTHIAISLFDATGWIIRTVLLGSFTIY